MAALGPSPTNPPASPSRRENHIAGVFEATSVSAPWPSNRSRKNPSPTTSRLGADAISRHPPHSPDTTPIATARSPKRSARAPTAGRGRAAAKLASA